MSEMANITVLIDRETATRFRVLAAERGLKQTAILRELIQKYLEENEPKKK